MLPLVSVIIPCYNTQRWIAEAIDSCLQQTYPHIEIIVVDDGSTDNSLEIIRSYGDKVILKELSHLGGNHARNVGFSVSQGRFIQYLDADDFILPEKIATQVSCSESKGADIVYGDWAYQYHSPDGTTKQHNQIAGEHTDVLEALLGDWWVSSCAYLFRREVITHSAGWDEELKALQDRDFIIQIAIDAPVFAYQPGVTTIYRKYGDITVGSSNKLRWLDHQCIVMDKAERRLLELGKFGSSYQRALSKCYFEVARNLLYFDYSKYQVGLTNVIRMNPGFKLADNNSLFLRLQNIIGFKAAEKITGFLLFAHRKLLADVTHQLPPRFRKLL